MSEERQDADSDSDRDSGNDEPNENVAENGGATAERVKREPSPSSTEYKLEDKSHEENGNIPPHANRRYDSEPRLQDIVFPPRHHHEERLHCRCHLSHHARDDLEIGDCDNSDLVQNLPPEVLMVVFSFLVCLARFYIFQEILI